MIVIKIVPSITKRSAPSPETEYKIWPNLPESLSEAETFTRISGWWIDSDILTLYSLDQKGKSALRTDRTEGLNYYDANLFRKRWTIVVGINYFEVHRR